MNDFSFYASLHFGHNELQPSFTRRLTPYQRWDDVAIRMCDVVGAALAIFLCAPLMLIIAVSIYVKDPGPILFMHTRLGRGGRTFPCFKFRSMVVDADARLRYVLATDPKARAEWALFHKLNKDPRVTPLGYFLRRTSLDELPQFFNVLLGDMSLVGSRPIVAAEMPRYGRYAWSYSAHRPGLTGLWQIGGRSSTSYQRRIAHDVLWSRRRCFFLYCVVLFKTVPAVLRAEGSC